MLVFFFLSLMVAWVINFCGYKTQSDLITLKALLFLSAGLFIGAV